MTADPSAADDFLATVESFPVPSPSQRREIPVAFNGTAGDYFGVWIVNLLLTILTLGIWSAWAKVRTKRWFYGHTSIDGHAFEYHATGMQIFKGRLLAIVLIILLALPGAFFPPAQLLTLLVLLFLMPWAINAGLRFNARVSSWRNVRFNFQGSYGRALWLFVCLPFITLLTLGLLTPVVSRMIARYVIGNTQFGNARMDTQPRVGHLYGIFGLSFLLFLALFIGIPLVLSILSLLPPLSSILFIIQSPHMASSSMPPEMLASLILAVVMPIILSFYLAIFVAALYYGTRERNEVLNQLSIDSVHGMRSTLSPWRLLWILISGGLATICSLGLAYPWARVRHYRYLATQVTLLAQGDLDYFVTAQGNTPSSFGGEFGELEGFASAVSL